MIDENYEIPAMKGKPEVSALPAEADYPMVLDLCKELYCKARNLGKKKRAEVMEMDDEPFLMTARKYLDRKPRESVRNSETGQFDEKENAVKNRAGTTKERF